MRRGVAVGIGALVVLGSVLAIAGPASAHNYLVSSDPIVGSTITKLPKDFSVTTNGVLLNINKDGSGFALQIRDAKGLYYGDGCVHVNGPGISMAAAVGAPGKYTITWQVISTDGHTVSNTYPFTWAPTGSVTPSIGQKDAPTCHGKYHLNQSGLPPANSGTGQQVVSSGTLDTVLWIGGAILLVAIAVVVTLVLVLRRRPSSSEAD
jgi:methionine-rich copper-binding protein CopC